MIRNEHERRVTRRKRDELADAIQTMTASPVPAGRDPEMHGLVVDGHRAQLAQLDAELGDYERLTTGEVDVELPALDQLGQQLITARIAAGWSQQELADAAGLAEGVIRRYEREQYQGASLHRLQLIEHTLATAKHQPTASTPVGL